MAMKLTKELPLPSRLKEEFPLSDELIAIKARRTEAIWMIFFPMKPLAHAR